MRVLPVETTYAAESICTHCGRFAGATIYVVGYGTSLLGFDWSRLAGRVTIALNNAVRSFAPTYHLYSDFSIRNRYWQHEYDDATTIVVQEDVARQARETKWKHVEKIRSFLRVSDNLADIPRNNDQLYVERTVATAGAMLAWKLGAARAYLLGVDGYRLANGICYADGTAHLSIGNADTDKTVGDITVAEKHLEWNRDFARLKEYFSAQCARHGAPPFDVYIANPRATVTAWPRITLEEALA